MSLISPTVNKWYQRKEERKDLPDPRGGSHVLSFLLDNLYPEGRRALARVGSGVTHSLEDLISDLMPDDPNMALPLPGGMATSINDLKRIYPALRRVSGGTQSVPIKDTVQQLRHSVDDVHGALTQAQKQGRVELVPHSFTQPVSEDDLSHFLSQSHGQEAAWWRPQKSFNTELPGDAIDALPVKSETLKRRTPTASTPAPKVRQETPRPIIDRINSLATYKEYGEEPGDDLLAIIHAHYEDGELTPELVKKYSPWIEKGKKALDRQWGR